MSEAKPIPRSCVVVSVFVALISAMPTAIAQQAPPPAWESLPVFDPSKPGEVGPVWTYHDERRAFIVMALPAGRSETRTFTVRNTGPLPTGPMYFWLEGEAQLGPNRNVKIDPKSECITRGAAPGETCSVNLAVTAVADGQFMTTVRFVQGIRNEPPGSTLRTMLPINGYGTGFGIKLPDGVIGNGSRCPAPGSRAEIALSDILRGNGYVHKEPDGSGLILSTAECAKVEFAEGRMDNEEGRTCGADIKQYKASSVDGPWTFVSRMDRRSYLGLLCENGILKLVMPTR